LNTYETILITTPNLSEDEEKTTVDALHAVITERGGESFIVERMGRRRLAYPIRKFDDGVYTRFLYDSDTETPKELDRRMRLSDRVLRALTVRLEKTWASDAKEDAVRIIERRAEEAKRAEEEAKAAAEAAAKAEAEGDASPEATAPAGEAAAEPATDAAAGETEASESESSNEATEDAAKAPQE
jgi:small subunit ribosomal protein S6